jgi:hypothetical protein
MSKKIIVINGKGGVGKDTLIKAVESMNEPHIGVYNESSIDPVRGMAARSFDGIENLSEAAKVKGNAYRKFLSDMKKAVDDYYMAVHGTKYTEEYLYRCACDFAGGIGEYRDSSEDSVLFVHIREPENIQSFVERVRAQLDVDIVTLLVSSCRAKTDYGNDSDNNVADYAYDFTYENDGSRSAEKTRFRKFFLSEIMKKENV